MRLIAQLNLWFIGPPEYKEYRLNGQSMVPFEPLLGYTSSSDPEVLRQEMQWLHRYTGRDGSNFIYSLEWIMPESAGGLVDANLRRTFLPVVENTRARWYIFYDPVLAARRRGIYQEIPIDFADPAVRDMFLSDLDYLAEYFEHPQYWKVGGRPALHFWAVLVGAKNLDDLFQEALDRGIYLLGDVFGQSGRPMPPLSAKTGFVIATPEIVATARRWRLPAVLPILERYFQDDGGLDLIPAFSCQYDDTEFQAALGAAEGREPVRILARDRGEIEELLRLGERYSRPIHGERYLFAGTIDNWAESTTLLPTRRSAPPFWDLRGGVPRVGYYHFEHLQAVRDVLFPEVPSYQGPRMEVDRGGRVRFIDCDLLGELRLRGRAADGLANPPDWRSGAHLREDAEMQRTWRPRRKPGGRPGRIRLSFRNLDGRKSRLRLEIP